MSRYCARNCSVLEVHFADVISRLKMAETDVSGRKSIRYKLKLAEKETMPTL